jgi:hypothetical protein
VELLQLDAWDVAERFVEAVVVEPADPFDGRELQLRARARDAVGDQLGLVGVHERFGERVVQAVADGADRREHEVIVERLGVVDARVLVGLNRSSQRAVVEVIVTPGSRHDDLGRSPCRITARIRVARARELRRVEPGGRGDAMLTRRVRSAGGGGGGGSTSRALARCHTPHRMAWVRRRRVCRTCK